MKRSLPDLLREQLGTGTGALCVGFSGGPDSTTLLHALAALPEARARGLRALHVDHGIHPDSPAWAARCVDLCSRLGVPCTVVRVEVRDARREGIEAAARRARYAAFSEHIAEREWLVLAHHRDDQVETILLKLLRGAGPAGLAGMRRLRPFARGQLWRPLLGVARTELHAYLTAQHLDAIDDPANHDPRFTRNAVRHEVLPLLRQRWPHADAAILHSAALCRAAADHLAAAARPATARLRRDDGALDAAGWLALPAALRGAVLDAWLHATGLPAPTDAARAELRRQAASARHDAVPRIRWPGAEVRVWDGALFAMPPLRALPPDWAAAWDGSPLALPVGCGSLSLSRTPDSVAPARLDPSLTIRLRRGGECIQPAGDPHTRALRDLFQRARMPPWLRDRCPLLHAGNALIAVADLWASADGEQLFATLAGRPHWTRPAWARRMEPIADD